MTEREQAEFDTFVEAFGDLASQAIALQFDISRVYWLDTYQFTSAWDLSRGHADDVPLQELFDRWRVGADVLRRDAKEAVLLLKKSIMRYVVRPYDPIGNRWCDNDPYSRLESALAQQTDSLRVWIAPCPE